MHGLLWNITDEFWSKPVNQCTATMIIDLSERKSFELYFRSKISRKESQVMRFILKNKSIEMNDSRFFMEITNRNAKCYVNVKLWYNPKMWYNQKKVVLYLIAVFYWRKDNQRNLISRICRIGWNEWIFKWHEKKIVEFLRNKIFVVFECAFDINRSMNWIDEVNLITTWI